MKIEKLSRFWRLSLGLLLFGLGQRFFYTGGLAPWAENRAIPLLLSMMSLLFFITGLLLVLPLLVWFYQTYRSDKRLFKLLGLYLVSAVLAGIVIGGVGQLLYDYTGFDYHSLRIGIWVSTTLVQSILKLFLCFGLVSIYRQLPLRTRLSQLRLPLLATLGVGIALLTFTAWFPLIGSFVTSIVDAIVLIATLFYFIHLTKEIPYEKTS